MGCKNMLVAVGSEKNKVIIKIIDIKNDYYKCKKRLEIECENNTKVHSCIIDNNTVYIVDTNNNTIIICDLEKEVIKKCSTGKDPRHICKINNLLYITNFESESISIIDEEKAELIGIIKCDLKPHGIVANDNKIYVACYEENKILEIDINSYNRRELTISGNPLHLICLEKCLFSLSHVSNGSITTEVDVIDYDKFIVVKKYNIKDYVTDFIYDKDNNYIINISIDKNGIYVIDLKNNEIKKQIYNNDYFEDISVCDKIYIANSNKNQILILNKNNLEVFKSLKIEFTPQYIKLF